MEHVPQRDRIYTRFGQQVKRIAPLLLLGVALMVAAVYAARRWAEANDAKPSVTTGRVAQPVRTVTAAEAPIQAWVFAEGTARSVQREYLTFEIAGRVTFVAPEKEGVSVEEGQVLAQLDKRRYEADVDAAQAALEEVMTQATAAEAEVRQAEAQLEVTRREVERLRQLRETRAVTQAEFEKAQASLASSLAAVQTAEARAKAAEASIAAAEARLGQAHVDLEEAEIVSPIDGIVAYLNIEEGRYFTPNLVQTAGEAEALATVPIVVIDPSEYEITVEVPSYEANRVEVGQPVVILPGGASDATVLQAVRKEALPPETWYARGQVYSVNPAVSPGGRSTQVRIRTTVRTEHLRDGMFVACWIAVESKPDAVIAPFDAFLYEENQPYVFVVRPEAGVVEHRDVVLGIQGLRSREIQSGVEAGEQLVTDGVSHSNDDRLSTSEAPAGEPLDKHEIPDVRQASRLARFFILRPVFGILLTGLFAVGGLIAYDALVKESLPDLEIPQATITTFWPGADPQTVEQEVTETIENELSALRDVKEIRSASFDSYSIVAVEFQADADITESMQMLRAQVDDAEAGLPADAEAPEVNQIPLMIGPF